ncbi:hypothetical protein ACEWY4_025815 [Coilia grayii]|uniref:Proline-rich protein 15-like protein A n=1 Tax=Coilia grayii TaxID=363190 RepID=A0ABD1IV57_9TELE
MIRETEVWCFSAQFQLRQRAATRTALSVLRIATVTNSDQNHFLFLDMADPAWWKLTFLRKKKSEAKVLYEIPAEFASNTDNKDTGCCDPTNDDNQFSARLEKIVDKSATKGRHVKVSHSGRFKEKKKIRATLAENPNLFPENGMADENHVTAKDN